MRNLQEFIQRSNQGEPVFLSEVERALSSLVQTVQYPIILHLLDDSTKEYSVHLPPWEDLTGEERALLSSFVRARIYNVLSAYGGRELMIVAPEGDRWRTEFFESLDKTFQIDLPRSARRGFGKVINVTDRMLETLSPDEGFSITLLTQRPSQNAVSPSSGPSRALARCLRESTMLADRLVLGMDIGGTDIKVAVSKGNRICFFKEYDWNPSAFLEIDELITPILLLAKLMLINYQVSQDPGRYHASQLEALGAAMNADGKSEEIQAALALFEEEPHPLFDEIGLCFPDVVIRNHIVGGEVYKMRGVRENLQERYEVEFRKLTHLADALRRYCTSVDRISLTNDGPMAAFTAATELSFSSDSPLLANGVFAHTLGTELGTGWIDERGRIPEIPLEVYNFIIDVGSSPQRAYHPDDLRSINNFNTHIGGTLQKYASQSGVFRLALQYLPTHNPPLHQQLIDAGFVTEGELDGKEALLVPIGAEDLRKPFLTYIMELTESGAYPECDRIFSDIGRFLAETSHEVETILQPKTKDRFVFGRLVQKPRCFSLMQETYQRYFPDGELRVADSSLAKSPLMKQLEQSDTYTVAQFAQAVGALSYANFTTRMKAL